MTLRDELLPRPFTSAFFADPYRTYTHLRGEAPVHRVALPNGSPIWLVLREVDVRAGLYDPRLSVNKAHSAGGYAGFSLPPALDANLLNIDDEDHLRLRRLVSKAFTPRRIVRLRAKVQATADRLADGLADTGTGDLVQDFAMPLPISVIGELFAVPQAERLPFANWVNNMLDPQEPSHVSQAVSEIHAFLVNLVSARRERPADDLLSGLIAARDDEDRLSEDELVSLAFLILMAGSENVQHLISSGLFTLLQHHDQLVSLRADLSLLPEAVEELLRFAHPNQMAIRRFATEDIEIGDTLISQGDTVMLCLAAANRDPARYPAPDTFDVRREDKTHLTLGHGLHYCLGAPLARMEIEIALSTLLRRFPSIRLGITPDQARWRSSFRSHALKALPITTGPGLCRH
ncbi:cytochrome P450 family protein [Streptomyces cucumeris]|uniref:cytochrome P450 family protein n=1 Tax=Streptomyces cucumeris TaxID=2962890 RepID=UPI003D75E69C